ERQTAPAAALPGDPHSRAATPGHDRGGTTLHRDVPRAAAAVPLRWRRPTARVARRAGRGGAAGGVYASGRVPVAASGGAPLDHAGRARPARAAGADAADPSAHARSGAAG